MNSAERTRSGRWGSKPLVRPARCLILKPLAPGLYLSSRPTIRRGDSLIGFEKAQSGSFIRRFIVLLESPAIRTQSGGPEGGSSPNTAHRRLHIPQTRTGSASRPFRWCGFQTCVAHLQGERDGSGSPGFESARACFWKACFSWAIARALAPFAYRIFYPLACVDWHRLLSPRAPVRSLACSQPRRDEFRWGFSEAVRHVIDN